jgi:methylated-DNA-[protein]-cysteine S-methyltransferase
VSIAIARIVGHLEGRRERLASIPLEMDGLAPFHRRVYEVARRVEAGRTATYGEIAAVIGSPRGARAVGQALARNPFAIIVPCHRILAAGGRPGGFSANGGLSTKARLLAIEGVTLRTGCDRDAVPFNHTQAVRALRRKDPVLGALMRKVGPYRLEPTALPNPFEALAEAIVYQQLTGKAAATIFRRVRGLFPGRRRLRAKDVLAASDTTLRSAGLSRAKALALKDLAAAEERGALPGTDALRAMDDEAVIAALTPIRGIGRWTVEMLLMFRLGRTDVLPSADYGVRKGFARVFGLAELPSPKAVLSHGERWRPYRTIASWYLWRALELPGETSG